MSMGFQYVGVDGVGFGPEATHATTSGGDWAMYHWGGAEALQSAAGENFIIGLHSSGD